MSKPKKPRQPIAQIGAMTLLTLARAAALDVDNGDSEDPYVKKVRAAVDVGAGIAYRRLAAKGLTPEDFK